MTATAAAFAPTAAGRRATIVARMRAAFQTPGILVGLASLAMLGGGPLPTIPVAEQR